MSKRKQNEDSKEVEQFATAGVTSTVDNLILQKLLRVCTKIDLKIDELVSIDLGICPFSNKQRIMVNHDNADEICMFCEKPVNEKVLVYQIERYKQVYCLESEAEELVNKAN